MLDKDYSSLANLMLTMINDDSWLPLYAIQNLCVLGHWTGPERGMERGRRVEWDRRESNGIDGERKIDGGGRERGGEQ